MNEQRALSLAEASDQRRRAGRPLGVKDTLVIEGFAHRRGSKITSNKPAPDSSPAVWRVFEAGRGPVAISPLIGITRNAWNVGAFALATDADGSIRNPAALNGVVGYKTTGELVPATMPANPTRLPDLLRIVCSVGGRDQDEVPQQRDQLPSSRRYHGM